VVAPIDITALRHERETRRGHLTLAHLRTEAYPVYATPRYPPVGRTTEHAATLSYERNNALIDAAKAGREIPPTDELPSEGGSHIPAGGVAAAFRRKEDDAEHS
jgi:hypothetical protein